MGKKATLNVLFLLRKNRVSATGESPVYMRITALGKNTEISINRSINPKNWSSEIGGAIGNSKEAKMLNSYIESIRVQLRQIFIELREGNESFDVKHIKNLFLGVEEDEGVNLIELMKEHNENMKNLVGVDFSYGTLKRYKTSLNHVQAFIKCKYNKEDIYINKLDYKFITDYEYYFKTIRKCSHNTTMKYIKNLRKIVNHAVATGLLDKDPFASYKMTFKKTDRGFLTEEELGILINKKFKIKRLEQIRDCFLFSCFTGLAYVDLKNLNKSNIEKDSSGIHWIKINRQKTDTKSSIPILSVTQQLIEKYANDEYCLANNVILPVKSNQKMNAYLKEIAEICGIDKNLSSHLARHTFATTVTLNNNVPIETISKMLGHTSIRTTNIYARLLDKKISKDMAHLNHIYTL